MMQGPFDWGVAMASAAVALGITGGVLGVISGLVVLAFAGVGGMFGVEVAGQVAVQSLVAVGFGVAGVVGGAVAGGNPRVAWWLMWAAVVGGVVAVSWGWVLAGPVLAAGAVCAGRARAGELRRL
jgi:hypothetical protein